MGAIDEYLLTGSPEESNWRSVILFGRNAASYKFALAQALIDLAKQDRDSVTLAELADPYTRHLCEHLTHSPKQSTSRSSKFIDACSGFNSGEVAHDELIATAVQLGFNNVLDAFHVVNQGDVPVKFFEKDFSRGSKATHTHRRGVQARQLRRGQQHRPGDGVALEPRRNGMGAGHLVEPAEDIV